MRIPENPRMIERGFTMIEVLMVIGLIAILALASVDIFSDYITESRYQETIAKLEQIKIGLVGDPTLRNQGVRTNFGMFGDLGALPAAGSPGLGSLLTNSTFSGYAPYNQYRVSVGWNGPYVSEPGPGAAIEKDAWGNEIQYDPSGNPVTLTSFGANGVAGGTGLDQDIVVSIPNESLYATVTGFICDNGGPYNQKADIEINFPDGSGNLSQGLFSVTTGDQGFFKFTSIPFGVRSITIYVPSQAAPSQTVGPVLITVDSPNFTVPCKQIDLNP